MVRALASQRYDPGSIPEPGVTCGLCLLLVLVPVQRAFRRVLIQWKPVNVITFGSWEIGGIVIHINTFNTALYKSTFL